MRRMLALRDELLRPDTPANRLIDSLFADGTMTLTPQGKVELKLGPAQRQSVEADPPEARPRRSNAELTSLITRGHARGLSQAQIAADHGVHVQTVRRHLAKAGVPTRRSPLSGDQLEEAKRLRADGWSLRALGERYGVAHTTVARLIAGK
jgi:lambda repressor-like predicted transcriptional regulator